MENIEGPNYEGVRGTVTVTRKGAPVTVLHPEKRRFWVQGSVQTTAAIADGLHRDLLASLGDDVGAGAYSLRFQYRPLIRFVWLGALIMAIGGVIVVVGRRQRGLGWAEDSAAARVPAQGRRHAGQVRMTSAALRYRFALPLGGFLLLLVVLAVGLLLRAREGHHRLAAARQAGAAVLIAGAAG